MSMILEVVIYLVIVFTIMLISVSFLNREIYYDEKYIIKKNKNTNVNIKVIITGVSEEEGKRIGWIIQRARFEDIYDIANKYEVFVKKDNETQSI